MSDDKPRPEWQVSTCPRCMRNSDPTVARIEAVDERRRVQHRDRAGHSWIVSWSVD